MAYVFFLVFFFNFFFFFCVKCVHAFSLPRPEFTSTILVVGVPELKSYTFHTPSLGLEPVRPLD